MLIEEISVGNEAVLARGRRLAQAIVGPSVVGKIVCCGSRESDINLAERTRFARRGFSKITKIANVQSKPKAVARPLCDLSGLCDLCDSAFCQKEPKGFDERGAHFPDVPKCPKMSGFGKSLFGRRRLYR
ncbi:MAG: hypothetical protein H7Z14_05765 [Anaerolineae bacterium]|nr:hypothetical protein [Phycisphaerae bacterium]